VLALESSLETLGVQDSIDVTATVATPECLVETALNALGECPPKASVYCTDPDEQESRKHAHAAWVRSGARVVMDQLEALSREVKACQAYREVVEDLALKVLEVPIFSEDEYAGEGLDELYPDELTWTAARVLAIIATPGERVNKVMLNWIGRIRDGDVYATTSDWTVHEVLQSIPKIFDATDETARRAAVKALFKKGRHCLARAADDYDWAPLDCYWATVKLMNAKDVQHMGIRFDRDGLWSEFVNSNGLESHRKYDKTVGTAEEEHPEDDEDWMKEFMYKPT